MERYEYLLEKALQARMHEDIPSDCEDWLVKNDKENKSRNSTTTIMEDLKSLSKHQPLST